MANKDLDREATLAAFFDDGAYTVLFAGGAVCAACGTACGQPVYAVHQNGAALSAKDVEKTVHTLELAAETGRPVVTFYDSVGAKLEEGLEVLAASSRYTEAVAKLSGVVPQLAVVTGVCGGTIALAAANADLCIMSRKAELFFTAPFTSAAHGDKLEGAGSADFAAKAGVAALVTEDAASAAALAAHLAGMLPANNLSGPAVFEFSPSVTAFPVPYEQVTALEALADAGSMIQLYEGFGPTVTTALATVGGTVVGLASTGPQLCRPGVSKLSRFVRLCDAFSIPVVTVADCSGFIQSVSQDMAGGLLAAARLAGTYADATTAKVAVIAGRAVGPVYTALANADVAIALRGCTIAPVEPAVAVSVLHKAELDAADSVEQATRALAARYAEEQCSADTAVAAGLAEMTADVYTVRGELVTALDLLATKRSQRLPKKHGNLAL